MSSTNKTTNIELSQYIATDKPTYLVDYNGDMLKIDNAIGADRDSIATAQNTADGADAKADANTTAIQDLNNELNDETTGVVPKLNDLTGDVNTIQSLIGNGEPTTTDKTIIGAINELNSDIDNLKNDIIFISASYGSTPSANDNCLVHLSNMLSGIYRNIYTSTHGGDAFHDGSYLAQLQSVTVADANAVKDIVVIGIGNDISNSWTDVSTAMIAFYNYAHATYPNAKISVAPVSTRTNQTDAQALYNLYVNMENSIPTTKISVFTQIFHVLAYHYSHIASDGIHPTSDGAATIARAIFNVLCNGSYEYTNYITLNNVSDHEVIDTNLTVTGAFYHLFYSGKLIKVRYGLNFTPTADENLSVNWSTGIALTKDTRLKGIIDLNSKEIDAALTDLTTGDTIPAAITLNYSAANGYYWELNSRTGATVTLLAGHNYYFRADGVLAFDAV